MATGKGREKPELAVQAFVNFLNEGRLEDAYRLLTSPERLTIPLSEWGSESWNSPDDDLTGKLTEIRIRPAKYTSPREAIVEAILVLSGDPAEVKATYTTRRENEDWYVHLGLDCPRGTWAFRWPE